MNLAYINSPDFSFFSDAQDQLDQIISQLQSDHYAHSEHGDIEQHIKIEGDELLRRLLQGWLDMKAANEIQTNSINTANGNTLNHLRAQTKRKLTSLFGDVTVTRKGYSQRHQSSRFPLDADLNLPDDQYSDGIRSRMAKEAIRGSFDNAIASIQETTGGHVPKRQSLNLVQDVAQDFEFYYKTKQFNQSEDTPDLLVLTFDGKGIVMRPDGLRACTQKAAQKSKKLHNLHWT